MRDKPDIAAPAFVLAELDDRHDEDQHHLANVRRAAALFDVIEHFAPSRVEHGGAIDHHLPDQLFLGSKVVVQRGVVPLAGGIDNLLNRHRVDAMAGEQHLRRRLDLVPGLFRGGARRRSHPA